MDIGFRGRGFATRAGRGGGGVNKGELVAEEPGFVNEKGELVAKFFGVGK